MTPGIWLGTTHPCNPPKNGLWVNLIFFMMCIYKHYVPPMLLVFAMKCFTNMPCLLPHNRYCCLLSSPMYLPHLLICTCLISSPVACPPSSVLCWCLLRFVTDVFSCLPRFFSCAGCVSDHDSWSIIFHLPLRKKFWTNVPPVLQPDGGNEWQVLIR